MKNFKRIFLGKINKSLLAFIGILGFTAGCFPKMEYGSPSADFILKGDVKSANTEQPIKNIQVVMNYDTTQTDENGNFTLSFKDFPQEHDVTVYFNDVDSSLNGDYQNKEQDVHFSGDDFKDGDGKWYEGYTEESISIKLDEEEK
ncbi:MAG: radical SAM-associated putative lipoprotein [Bacteroidales bacterium]|nr:radical SAM-associated putative lipoprotein [Bacteroidales bacterium]